ncbi:MAG: TatD family hydrolase [Candidatus Diapherotrites archaeon]|nr:TatD family hydrolase [Candidatus Diapherotrites archaeon]
MDLIDTHCHLDDKQFDGDRDAVLARARSALKAVITVGVDGQSNDRALSLADNEFVFAALGLAPVKHDESVFQQVRSHAESIVAVGEVGLDYYWEKSDALRAKQREWFGRWVDLAKEVNKPLVVHCRDAMDDCFTVLERDPPERVIFHCFSGNEADLEGAEDNGFFVSMATNVCFSQRHARLINKLPLQLLLTETDSPYLSPDRKRNEPINVIASVRLISSVLDMDADELASIVFHNALRAFPGLKPQ